MAPRPFRPDVTPLEDRTTPAVSPADVLLAAQQTASAQTFLRDLGSQLNQVRGEYVTQFLIRYLPTVQQVSLDSVNVLGEFRAALEAQLAANPAAAGTLVPALTATRAAETNANLNIGYAELYRQGFVRQVTGQPAVPFTPRPANVDFVNPSAPITEDAGPTDPLADPNGIGNPNLDLGTDTDLTDVDPAPVSPINAPLDAGMVNVIPDVNAPQWQTRPNGLRVWDVVEGTGTPVAAGSTVTVHYTGWLLNGTKFDSSRDRGQPSQFSLNQVIAGWQQGIPGMKPGGIRRLVIPAELAYGSTPRGNIPANSVLVFEVKMISSP